MHLFFFLFFMCTVACSSPSTPPDTLPIDTATKKVEILESDTGLASFYGRAFEGKKTASGEIFNPREMVAAHPSYPLGTRVLVTNLENGDTVQVRIIDRGPTRVNRKEGVIIDISSGAAQRLKMVEEGRVKVVVAVLAWGEK